MEIFRLFVFFLACGAALICLFVFMKRSSRFLYSFFLTLFFVLCLVFASSSYIWLALFGEKIQAVVVKLDCEHGRKKHVYYKYIYEGKDFFGVSPDGYGGKSCDDLKIGDVGFVYHLPGDAVSVWGDPVAYIQERGVVVLFVLLAVPFFSYSGISKKWAEDA